MSISLTSDNLYKKLDERIFYKNRNTLAGYLKRTRKKFIEYSKECKNSYGTEKYINPLLWQAGHVVFFYINLIIDNISVFRDRGIFDRIKPLIDFYDSFKTPLENRQGRFLIKNALINEIYLEIVDVLISYLENKTIKFTKNDSYLVMLGILHNEMHNEAFIFTNMSINRCIPFDMEIKKDKLIKLIEFVHYRGGIFYQGSDDIKDYLIFDNEKPKFVKKIKPFFISKHQITEYMFLQFVLSGGYRKNRYWCRNGYIWKEKNKIEMPLYWIREKNGAYYKFLNSAKHTLETNLPVINISYYEAQAYCRWQKVRLPTESEYEYVSTNAGTTQFPWGNTPPDSERCNINYRKFLAPVDHYQSGSNSKGVCQLIGNSWEWCEEQIYPYDGFKIDPVYREMSYPFFGFKKICKGGAFCVPDFLIHPRYRNAQYPDCRIQFIGFRVCK